MQPWLSFLAQLHYSRNRGLKKYHNRGNNRNGGFLKTHNRSITSRDEQMIFLMQRKSFVEAWTIKSKQAPFDYFTKLMIKLIINNIYTLNQSLKLYACKHCARQTHVNSEWTIKWYSPWKLPGFAKYAVDANLLRLESSIITGAKRATNRNNVATEKREGRFYGGEYT